MLPVMSSDLGKAAIREVISLAASILGSGTLFFNEVLNGAVLGGIFGSWSWYGALNYPGMGDDGVLLC